MKLYIMRHGIACDQSEWNGTDSERPLTEEGIRRTEEVLRKLRKNEELLTDAIWSSPFTRALQTAEIAGKILGLQVRVIDQLECGAHLSSLMRIVKKEALPLRLMTVGHEPDCGEITAELLGDPSAHYSFKRAGIAHLEGELKPGGMKLIWHYAPKDVLGD